jgi:CelD/BcsL family acetyltransferase involved in cellulose biosynthesis
METLTTIPAPSIKASAGGDAAAGGAFVEVVRDSRRLEEMRAEWQELFDCSPTASVPLRFEWVSQWWRVFGPIYGNRGRGLRLLTVRRGSRLIGVLPLYEVANPPLMPGRRLRFISAGAAEFEETCAEYLDLLHAPGEEQTCVQLIGQTLRECKEINWDELWLSDLSEKSPLVGLAEALQGDGRLVKIEQAGGCHVSDMRGGWEAYLGRLASGTRAKARKMLRDIASVEKVKFEIAATAEQAGEFFDQLVELHHKRWAAEGKTGSFAPRHAEFHRAVSVALAARGEVMLARLSHGADPMSVVYGHRVGKRFDSYQMGNAREECVMRSPGTATFLALAAQLAKDGVEIYDHLKGFNSFKRDYAKDEHRLVHIRARRATWRSAMMQAADLAGRAMRKGRRMLAGQTPDPAPKADGKPAEE